jgi:hypothetical protein
MLARTRQPLIRKCLHNPAGGKGAVAFHRAGEKNQLDGNAFVFKIPPLPGDPEGKIVNNRQHSQADDHLPVPLRDHVVFRFARGRRRKKQRGNYQKGDGIKALLHIYRNSPDDIRHVCLRR